MLSGACKACTCVPKTSLPGEKGGMVVIRALNEHESDPETVKMLADRTK